MREKQCVKHPSNGFILMQCCRLSAVQETKPLNAPLLETIPEPAHQDKKAVLQNIETIVPNHDARLQGVEVSLS